MNQSNPSLSFPTTSAAAFRVSDSKTSVENIESARGGNYEEEEDDDDPQTTTDIEKSGEESQNQNQKQQNKNHLSSKYSNSFKRAVASTVQNVSNSLEPLNFLHRRLFKNNSNSSNNKYKSAKSDSKNNFNNGSNLPSTVEVGSRSFFAGLTPTHTSKNPNYQILDESLNVSTIPNEKGITQQSLSSPSHPITPMTENQSISGNSSSSNASDKIIGTNKEIKNQATREQLQELQQKHQQTTEQCNLLSKDEPNYILSTSRSNIKDTKSSQNQNEASLSSAHELFLNSGVSNPIRLKDNIKKENIATKETSSTMVLPKFNATNLTTKPTPTVKTTSKSPYQLKETWLQQQQQQPPPPPPNGFIRQEL